MDSLLVFLAQVLSASTPLLLATLGGTVSERSGVATIGLEGYLLSGAFFAAVCAVGTGSVWVACVGALLMGAAMGALFALATVTFRAHAIVAGVAINLFAAAATRVALKVIYDSASNSPPLLMRSARSGGLGRVALLDALSQPVTWLAILAVLLVILLLSRTPLGMRIHAAGEHPEALEARGISVTKTRWIALVLGGALAGLGGAHLALAQHEFVAYMSAGRGFLALAAVIIGAWRPAQTALAAVAIGSIFALEASLAGRHLVAPALLQALPYAVTLLAVVGLVQRNRAPAALG
ncbi:MAG: ABC transporter permease [Deltaproteobacteria bacterium]|nr:ABC transporter permease [Deltaproteobacteria bacterium]